MCVGVRISPAEILMIEEEALGGRGSSRRWARWVAALQRHCLAELQIPGKARSALLMHEDMRLRDSAQLV